MNMTKLILEPIPSPLCIAEGKKVTGVINDGRSPSQQAVKNILGKILL